MKKKIKTIILLVVYLLTFVGLFFVTPRYNEEDYIVKENDYPEVEIKDLTKKFEELDFKNKTRDDYKEENIAIKSNIFNGRVTVTISMGDEHKKYILEDIDNVISTRSNYSEGSQVTYILTEEGIVYKIVDELDKVKETDDYMGKPVDMGLINAEAIATNTNSDFHLNDKNEHTSCNVYIKTKDGRMFTNESFLEGSKIVELIEQKEQTNKTKKK